MLGRPIRSFSSASLISDSGVLGGNPSRWGCLLVSRAVSSRWGDRTGSSGCLLVSRGGGWENRSCLRRRTVITCPHISAAFIDIIYSECCRLQPTKNKLSYNILAIFSQFRTSQLRFRSLIINTSRRVFQTSPFVIGCKGCL